MSGNTLAVQRFVRFVAWFISITILGLFIVLPLSIASRGAFGTGYMMGIPATILSLWLSQIISSMFYILPEWEEMVVLRLGKFNTVRGAGFFIIPPFIYSVAAIVDKRIETRQVEATATLTKDNVPTKVTAAIEYMVENARKTVIDVLDYRSSVSWLATEALKNTIGSMDLKELLSEREQIAESLKVQIDKSAAEYGIDVRAVRITDIDTPTSLVEELAVIARARRAAEAKLVQAEAEVGVANKIAEASTILNKSQGGMRLRELQALTGMSKEESAMIIIYPYGDRGGQEIAHAITSKDKTENHKRQVAPAVVNP